jgi:hypothetical protein
MKSIILAARIGCLSDIVFPMLFTERAGSHGPCHCHHEPEKPAHVY